MRDRNEAQAVIVRGKGDARAFLIIRRRGENGIVQMRLVKGGIDAGEKPEEAVLREVQEEVGLTKTKVTVELGYYDYTVDDIRHCVTSFLVEASGGEEAGTPSLDEGDATIEEAIWVSAERALELVTFDNEKRMMQKAIEALK